MKSDLPQAGQCQRLVKASQRHTQCPNQAIWVGRLHVGHFSYMGVTCDDHVFGLLDAETIEETTVATTP
jgi:hypothetical protein